MDEDRAPEGVIRARGIELLDDDGNPSVILEAREAEGHAGLTVSSVEEGAPMLAIGIQHETRAPYLLLALDRRQGPEGPSVTVSFEAGGPVLRLRDAEGNTKMIRP